MRGLWARLLVSLAVPTFIGLLLADVAFLFWRQAELVRERQVELLDAATELAARDLAHDGPAGLETIARAHDVALTLVRADGSVLASADVPLPSFATTPPS